MCAGGGTYCFIGGLIQASAPEDCRLMWPIWSDNSCMVTVSPEHTCILLQRQITARKKKKKKPQDMVHTFVYSSKVTLCVFFEINLHFVMLPFLSFFLSFMVSDFDIVLILNSFKDFFLSLCFLLILCLLLYTQAVLLSFPDVFPFVSSVIVITNSMDCASQWNLLFLCLSLHPPLPLFFHFSLCTSCPYSMCQGELSWPMLMTLTTGNNSDSKWMWHFFSLIA